MIGLDTTVIVRLLVGEPVAQAKAAQVFLNELFESGEKAAVSDLVVSETYFALQYHYNVPKAEALDALDALFQSGEIVASGAAASVLKTKKLSSAKPGFVDRLIHSYYQEKYGAMATFEKKAARLEGARVLK